MTMRNFFSCLCGALFLFAFSSSPKLVPLEPVDEIVIQNRILVKINEKNISVLDVVKQIDLFLSRHYPQYLYSKAAKYQYYTSQWRPFLQQMIDTELMVLDAESCNVKISEGDVREEIQNRFGPNVMEQLELLGISYEEMKKIVHQEMLVQRIQWLRVTSKVLQRVTSEELKKSYQKYLLNNENKGSWKYQFLTIRSQNLAKSQEVGQMIFDLKEGVEGELSKALSRVKGGVEGLVSLSLSQEFQLEEGELSKEHKELLLQLNQGDWSLPVVQISRDGTETVRIFHLKGHQQQTPRSFQAIAKELKQELLNEFFVEENQKYLNRLQLKFGFNQSFLQIAPSWEPFSRQ